MIPDDGTGKDAEIARLERDLAAARAELERARDIEADRDEFLSVLGHELRNPLAALRSGTALLKGRKLDEATLRMVTDIFDRQSAVMVRLVEELLDISRVMRGKITLESIVLDLADVVGEVLADRQGALTAARLSLRRDLEPRLWVRGDRARLVQIVDHLLANAIKFTGSSGMIQVTTRRRGDHGVLLVRDSGTGIEKEALPLVFEPFRRSRQSLERSRGGLGLGLGLSKGLVELHGGTIRVESDGLGHGTSVTVELPLSSAGPTGDTEFTHPGG